MKSSCNLHLASARPAALLLLLLVLGCSANGPYKVEGVVTLDGESVEGAMVVFEPETGSGQSANAFTRDDGSFQMETALGMGAMRGTYRVTVSKMTGPSLPPPSLGPNASKEEIDDANKKHRDALRQRKSHLP